MAYSYAEIGFGRRQGAGDRPALVVVDLSYAFTDPVSPLCCDPAGCVVAANVRLVAAARAAGRPVIFTTVAYNQATDRIVHAMAAKVPTGDLREGSRWVEIDQRLGPLDEEWVLTKLFPSAFAGTPLSQALVAAQCDTVVVTGASTSGCVRATALDALQHGFRVVIPRGAVGDRASSPHNASLFDIDQKIGDVVAVDEAAALLRGR